MKAQMESDITPMQCRMARNALGLGVRDVGREADVSPNTVARFERGEYLLPRTIKAIQGVFEEYDLIFETDSDGYEYVGIKPSK